MSEVTDEIVDGMADKEIQNILNAYVESRKRDESQNKDANRRYYISSLKRSGTPWPILYLKPQMN